jgi:subtilisin family serine protease
MKHLSLFFFFCCIFHLNANASHLKVKTISVPNDKATDAISLPINLHPCGKEAISFSLNMATTSGTGPFGSCSSSFVSKDIWYKVITPNSGNFLLQRNDQSSIQLYAEAYLGLPSAMNVIACQAFDEFSNHLVIAGQTPGQEIYFRFWDAANVSGAQASIAAHELPNNMSNWKSCESPSSGSLIGKELGLKKATEVIVQYDADDNADSIAAKRAIIQSEFGATLVDSCKCAHKNLEVWRNDTPIEMEGSKRGMRRKGNVDTTGYNYVLQVTPLYDSLIETRILSNNGLAQSNADISMDSLGNYVIVWQQTTSNSNHWDIYARLFFANGSPQGNEFRVSSFQSGLNQLPAVSKNKIGDFTITWESDQAILVKQYDKNGNVILAETEVKKDGSDAKGLFEVEHPDVAMHRNGGFAVTYQKNYTSNPKQVEVQLYNASAALIANHNLESTQESYQLPQVAMANNGNFMVVFSTYTGIQTPVTGADAFDIKKQSFLANGNLQGGISTVNSHLTGAQINPKIAMAVGGNGLIAWTEVSAAGMGDVKGRRFNSNGTVLIVDFFIDNTPFGEQHLTAITMNDKGDHIVTWEGLQQDGDGSGVYSQYYDRNNNAVGNAFRVHTLASGNQEKGKVALNLAGNVIYTWQEITSDLDVFHKRYIRGNFYEALKDYRLSADTIGISKDTYDRSLYQPSNTVGNILIATMDSGIEHNHFQFKYAHWQYSNGPNCLSNAVNEIGYDFNNEDGNPNDVDGHGTGVNGMIVESFPSDLQLDIMNLKFYEQGESTLFDAICGIYYAIEKGAKVINLSWGFESEEMPVILKEALEIARCQDIIVITSAGNNGKNNDKINKYPANYSATMDNVISVAALELDQNGQNPKLADYSNFGPQTVDIAANGFVETTGLNNSYISLSGTSLSAPIVSRIAAIIRARFPQLSAAAVKDCIINSDNVQFSGLNVRSGGALDAVKALACAQEKANQTNPPCTSEKISLNANIKEESCQGVDGAIELIITGDTSNLSYLWGNGFTTKNLTGLKAGTYSVTVTDDCNCIQTMQITLSNSCNNANCNSSSTILDQPIQGKTYRSQDSIISHDTIAVNLKTTFQASNFIRLTPGFSVVQGAEFKAIIADCTPPTAFKQVLTKPKKRMGNKAQLLLFPNPTYQYATIRYFIPQSGQIAINLFDLNGRILQTFQQNHRTKGWYEKEIYNLKEGVYFVSLKSETDRTVQKLTVIGH